MEHTTTRTRVEFQGNEGRKLALIENPDGHLQLSISTRSKQVGFDLSPEIRQAVADAIRGES